MASIAALSNAAQAGQVIEPYSTSFTGAAGLPITKPPSAVVATVWVQSPPLGAGIGSIGPDAAAVAALPSFDWSQPARSSAPPIRREYAALSIT